MAELEPSAEHDPFLDDLKRYMRDVMALEAGGFEDLENNRDRLMYVFYDLVEKLCASDEEVVEKVHELIPRWTGGEAGLMGLVLEYKLAPLRLLDQRSLNCVLPLESLTPRRIETIFNYCLAGEDIGHQSCIIGDEEVVVSCEVNGTCPMKLGRRIGKDLITLFVVQRHFNEDDVKPADDLALYNLLQLERTLVANKLLLPTEVQVYTKVAERYIYEQLLYLTPPSFPRTSDETNDTDI